MHVDGRKLCFMVALVALFAAPARFFSQDAPENMAFIAAGDFWMGRTHYFLVDAIGWFERDRQDDIPAHKVFVDPFYIDKYEVSNQDYEKFAAATNRARPWHWVGGKIPKNEEKVAVYNVTWFDADAYCKWAGKRLPSEAEWEKAARGGLDRAKYPWGDTGLGAGGYGAPDVAVDSNRGTQANANYPFGAVAVGSFPANGYGLFDMAGNVWEWTNDWYERNYYTLTPRKNPAGPTDGRYKVIRGGAWADDDERNLMNSFRNYTDPDLKAASIGFRCAKSVPVSSTGGQ